MTFYEEMQNVASEVLAEFKQSSISYVDMVSSGGTPDEPGTVTPISYSLDAVSKGVSFKYVKDGLALSTDLTVTAAIRSDVIPNMKGFVSIDGVRYKIVQDISTPAAGTPTGSAGRRPDAPMVSPTWRRSASSSPTPSACTTSSATPGNGRRTARRAATSAGRPTDAPGRGWAVASVASCAAEAG